MHAIGGTVLFRSIMVAVLPRLTRAFVQKDRPGPAARLGDLGMHLMISVSFPLTALGVVLAVPAAQAVFGIGRFSHDDARLLGLVIAVLSVSFIFSAVQRALLLPYYAVRDTKVPLRNSVYGALANVVLLPLCVLPLRNTDYADYALLGLAAAYVLVQRGQRRARLVAAAALRAGHAARHRPRSCCAPRWRRSSAPPGRTSPFAELPHPMPGGQVVRLAIAGVLGLLPVLVLEVMPPLRRRHRRRRPSERGGGGREGDAKAGARQKARTGRRGRHAPRPPSHPALVILVVAAAAAGGTLTALAFVAGLGHDRHGRAGRAAGRRRPVQPRHGPVRDVRARPAGRPGPAWTPSSSAASNAVLDPAALLGMLFLGAGVVWLLAQWREEGRLRLSPLGWAVVGFAGAGAARHDRRPGVRAGAGRVDPPGQRLRDVARGRAGRGPAIFRSQIVAAVMLAAVIPLAVAAYQLQSGAGLFDAGGFGRATGTFTHSNPMAAFMALVVVMAFAHVVHSDDLRAAGLVRSSPWPPPRSGCSSPTPARPGWPPSSASSSSPAPRAGAGSCASVGGAADRAADRPGRHLPVLRPERGDHRPRRAQQLADAGASEYWAEALDLAHASPITGIGLKQVAAQSEEGKQPHNDFLRAYVEMGVVGLAAYLWMIWQFLNTGRRAVRVTRDGPARDKAFAIGFAGCAAGYVLMCLVANLMSQVVVGVYFAAFAGGAAAIVTARNGWRDRETSRGRGRATTEVETRMRILHVNKFLHRKGGAEGYMLDLADLQRQHGHEVAFFGMDHPEQRPGQRRHARRRTSSSSRRPRASRPRCALAARMIWSRQAAKGMEEAIDAFRPDVVHAHNIYHQLSPSVVHAAAKRGVPVVLTMHDYKLACPTYQFLDHGKPCTACVTEGPWEAARRGCKDGSRAGSTVAAIEVSLHRRFGAYDGVRRFISPSRFLAEQMTAAGVYPDRIRVQSNFTDLDRRPAHRRGDPGRASSPAGSPPRRASTRWSAPSAGRPPPCDGPRRRAARHRRRRPGARRARGAGRDGGARAGPLPRPTGPRRTCRT